MRSACDVSGSRSSDVCEAMSVRALGGAHASAYRADAANGVWQVELGEPTVQNVGVHHKRRHGRQIGQAGNGDANQIDQRTWHKVGHFLRSTTTVGAVWRVQCNVLHCPSQMATKERRKAHLRFWRRCSTASRTHESIARDTSAILKETRTE